VGTPLLAETKEARIPEGQAITQPLAPALSSITELTNMTQVERNHIDRAYGLDCTIHTRQSLDRGHRIQHPQMYRLCTGGLLSGDLLRALLELQSAPTPAIFAGHLDNWVRDPLRTNTPARRLLQQLYKAEAILLLHNHDNVHWGLSITLRKANHHHVLYLDSLNQRHPELDEDLTHFWTRSTRAAHQLQLAPDSTPRTTIHHLQVPTQTNNWHI
jgi:hypothetical protein